MQNIYYDMEDMADELIGKIIKRYDGFHVSIDIKSKDVEILNDRVKFKVKLLQGTRVENVRKYERDVKIALKLPLFQVMQEGLNIFIIASKFMNTNNNLLRILASPEYGLARKTMKIVHPLGFDPSGKPIIADLALYPHAMVCGTTGSGKTVCLQSLLAGLVCGYSPQKINLIICDKTDDLLRFANVPHLAHPIIDDFDTFLKVMLVLKEEMERRIKMKQSKMFTRLPAIVCVVDEFLAFISGSNDTGKLKLVRDTVSDILRRARHARIHLLLAVHNPTKQNMKIDMGDLPTKIGFRVPKYIHSVTMFGESGAEKLLGNGDMLFQSSQDGTLQRIQGANILPDEITSLINETTRKRENQSPEANLNAILAEKYRFVIKEDDLQQIYSAVPSNTTVTPTQAKSDVDNKLHAEIALWALGRDKVSCNMICEKFGIGWKRASIALDKLYQLGVIGDMYAKLPRAVLPILLCDLTPEAINFWKCGGYTTDDIQKALNIKNTHNLPKGL